MNPLSASELLNIWERGQDKNFSQRALLLLIAANPGKLPKDFAKISIGKRDANLFKLRGWIFGPNIIGLTKCPACNELIEMNINLSDIIIDQEEEPPERLSVVEKKYKVEFRLPTSMDLEAVEKNEGKSENYQLLLQRCVLNASNGGKEIDLDKLPKRVIDSVINRMEEVDPQANIQLILKCPQCSHNWLANFDIVSFFWNEIDAWARRILQEIDCLASAYGWQEKEILALSPFKRQLYFNMITK
jgi:hypothetical protein